MAANSMPDDQGSNSWDSAQSLPKSDSSSGAVSQAASVINFTHFEKAQGNSLEGKDENLEPSVKSSSVDGPVKLTKTQEDDIHTKLNMPKKKFRTEYEAYDITQNQMNLTFKKGRIHGPVINAYMTLIKERNENKDNNLPPVHVINSMWSGNPDQDYTRREYKEYMRKENQEVDLIIAPRLADKHWWLHVVDVPKKHITVYSSLKGKTDQGEFLPNYNAFLTKGLDIDPADFETEDRNIPEQTRDDDCGVFVCFFAEYKTRRSDIIFNQADIPDLRKQMTYEILHKKLLKQSGPMEQAAPRRKFLLLWKKMKMRRMLPRSARSPSVINTGNGQKSFIIMDNCIGKVATSVIDI